jgi:integrase
MWSGGCKNDVRAKKVTTMPRRRKLPPGVTSLPQNRAGEYGFRLRPRLRNGRLGNQTVRHADQNTALELALRKWAELQADLHRNPRSNPTLGRQPFSTHKALYERTKDDVEPSTMRTIASRLRSHYTYLDPLPIGEIRASDIRTWRKQLKGLRGLSNDSLNSSLGTLRQIFRTAQEDGIIPENPCLFVQPLRASPRHEIVPASVDQIVLLADTLSSRYRAAVLLDALGAGLRAGELWALEGRHYDPELRELRVCQSLREGRLTPYTKTRRPRTVRLDHTVARMLDQHLDEFPCDAGYIFSTEKRTRVDHNNFMKNVFGPALKSLGSSMPSGFRFHDLRHTHAALLIRRAWRPEQIKERLGHASIRTTFDWYGHLFDRHDTDQLDAWGDELGFFL